MNFKYKILINALFASLCSFIFVGFVARSDAQSNHSPSHPQAMKRPEYKKATIQISPKQKNSKPSAVVHVELADTAAKWEYGLMYQRALAENEGMLFIFPDEEIRNFWMKNTFIDLAIGYFDAQKKLISVHEMKKVSSELETNLPTYPSLRPAKYALEVPKGWFEKYKIKIGDKLVLP